MSTEQIDIYADDSVATMAYKIAVMQAAAEGKPVQVYVRGAWQAAPDPLWDWISFTYRINPASRQKKRVPLTAEDVPAVCWVRRPGRTVAYLVTGVDSLSIRAADMDRPGGDQMWHGYCVIMIDGWEYSTDRKTWRGCWKEVAQ